MICLQFLTFQLFVYIQSITKIQIFYVGFELKSKILWVYLLMYILEGCKNVCICQWKIWKFTSRFAPKSEHRNCSAATALEPLSLANLHSPTRAPYQNAIPVYTDHFIHYNFQAQNTFQHILLPPQKASEKVEITKFTWSLNPTQSSFLITVQISQLFVNVFQNIQKYVLEPFRSL